MSVVDPRTDGLDHAIKPDQVYGDTRHEPDDGDWPDHATYEVIYVDEGRILLKTVREDEEEYRLTTRDAFEKNVGSGRFKLLESGENGTEPEPEYTDILATVKRLRDHYDKQGSRTGNHKAEALQEAVQEIEQIGGEEMDHTKVSGVGEAVSDRLKDAGYTHERHISAASKEELTEISGVGDAVAERLKEAAS